MVPQQLVDKIVPILKEFNVNHASLFGSVVRGEETPQSDIDILVELPKGITLFKLSYLHIALETKLHRRVDLVQYNFIKSQLRSNILQEKVDIL